MNESEYFDTEAGCTVTVQFTDGKAFLTWDDPTLPPEVPNGFDGVDEYMMTQAQFVMDVGDRYERIAGDTD